MRRSASALAAFLSVLALAACSSYRDPVITGNGASMAEQSAEAMTLRLGLDLSNPNREPLKLLEFDYSVSINGVHVYDGVRAAETTLASEGRKEVSIPIVIRFDKAGWNAQDLPSRVKYEVRGELRYNTPGEFAQALFDTGVRRPSAGFRLAGEADLAMPGSGTARSGTPGVVAATAPSAGSSQPE